MNSPTRCVASLLACWVAATTASAQVITDGTVGSAGAIGKIGSDFPIPHTLGTKNGGNLFHSFTRFDLVSGESATFTGPGDVTNILARVTGSSASSIDGTLRSTIPGANLFFINPKGVIFGANAKLEIDGSFTATTASYLKLANGGRFDAANPASDSLTSAPVEAFGFLGSPAPISMASSQFTTGTDKGFALIAGNLTSNNARIIAPGGRVNLVATDGAGEVPLVPESATRGIRDAGGAVNFVRTTVDTSGTRGGGVVIRGGRLTLDRSVVTSTTSSAGRGGALDVAVTGDASITRSSRVVSLTSGTGTAGGVSVRAGGALSVTTNSVVGSQATAAATSAARAGEVKVNARRLTLADDSTITGSTFGPGRGGTVDVRASDLELQSGSGIFSNTNAGAGGGNGGAVRVQADRIRIANGAGVSSDTSGTGRGGDVFVKADTIAIKAQNSDRKTGIFADTNFAGRGGRGGDLFVEARRLTITDGGLVSTKTLGLSQSGDAFIDVGTLEIARGQSRFFTGIAADTPVSGGPGGNVRVNADYIHIFDGGQISANTSTDGVGGPGGSVFVDANRILLEGGNEERASAISAESAAVGPGGNAGDVEVTVRDLVIRDGARISASAFGFGAGGDVSVKAESAFITSQNLAIVTGILAATTSTDPQAGPGGTIRADFGDLRLGERGSITASTFGAGQGGDVEVSGRTITITGGSRISADTSGLGAGGSVRVQAGTLSISGVTGDSSSGIFSGSTATGEGGAGGTVEVIGDTIRIRDRGTIAGTSSSTGAGGSVSVRATRLTLDTAGSVAASATGDGVAGSVSITVQEPLVLNGGSAVRTTSTVSSAGTVAITSATDIFLNDSTVAVSALSANAGQVSLRAPGTISLRNSSIVAEAGLNGGNVFIDPEFVLLDQSRISANAVLGAGGNILIIANSFFASSSAVTASSEASVPGNVQIQSLIVDLSGALVPLSSSVLDASTRLREQCARRLGLDFSSFLVVGRGGTALTPEDPAPASTR